MQSIGRDSTKDITFTVAKANGELANVDEWGKRKLAYAINYENDGYYVVYTFTSKTDFPAEFERIINITDGVLRSLVVLSK